MKNKSKITIKNVKSGKTVTIKKAPRPNYKRSSRIA